MTRETFGTYLKTARAARSLPLSEVALITKIPERSLELLERGAADGLPADVFVKGFVGSYAKVVGLDVKEAMARYGEAVRGEPTVAPRSRTSRSTWSFPFVGRGSRWTTRPTSLLTSRATRANNW